ncbi:phosphoadenosine phosphosulfate reductase domain-containing protein [Marinomonas transparens]|uniref:Phosphoadenosine phosphosulfate reductase family protein n=1 Tax=Marinomonas transparens TaxID=2795388 RepID=A0A934JNU9_9GAMM|nr:phosphoadenosine phosphosulfate reductase family protein [Marinomonas transparens]MBJ7536988.1 phosphoadenosine phosphosulfate reductase family protein [Marinomonas transparens]
MRRLNVVNVSGGKDSTATLLVAIEREVKSIVPVFADTGNEHEQTYQYLDYLEKRLGLKIERVKADFSKQIVRKRTLTMDKWRQEGVEERVIERAISVLEPTGNPFLDLCLWKGRFPSMKARFCTEELKIFPINQFIEPMLGAYESIYSWQGVRAEESPSRAKMPEIEVEFGDMETGKGIFNYRPILRWTADQVFEFHRKHGVDWNPLYEQGMGRVGCMPCVNCNKTELRKIAEQFPEVVERLREWEELVSVASKRQSATFFPAVTDPMVDGGENIMFSTHGIDRIVDWSKTARGGRQFDLLGSGGGSVCHSVYGLCE